MGSEMCIRDSFDSLHLANSSINDLIEANYRYHMRGQSLEEFLVQDTSKIPVDQLSFFLTKAPELDSLFQVKVEVNLSTGENYEVDSPTIIIRQ